MAWIKDGKVHKIVTGHTESTFHMNLEAHKKRGWKIKGDKKMLVNIPMSFALQDKRVV